MYSFCAAIQACAAAEQPVSAMQVFAKASDELGPHRMMFNAVLDAVCGHGLDGARALWLRGMAQGHYAGVEGEATGTPTLDLHGLSLGAAETAVRWWLDERALAETCVAKRLEIVTGWGKSRSALQSCDMRGRVAKLLAELDVPTLPTDNPGRLVIDVQAWRNRRL